MNSKSLSGVRLVVFDLDGTLIDSEMDLAQSVNATRKHLGLDPLPLELVATYVGQGVTTLIRRSLGPEASEETIERSVAFFLDYYGDHMLDHTKMYSGVREALDALDGRTLAVLTNKPVNFSRRILQRLSLDSCFAFIYGGNSFDQKKPDPVGLLRLMEDTGASPPATMIVGDSDVDIQTGRNAGTWTCAVTYGLGAHTLAQSSPDLVVDDLRKLASLLNRAESANLPPSPLPAGETGARSDG